MTHNAQLAHAMVPSVYDRTFPDLMAHTVRIPGPAMNYSGFVNTAAREGLNDACDFARDMGVPSETIESWADHWLAAMSDF